jgi:hypothetical protein
MRRIACVWIALIPFVAFAEEAAKVNGRDKIFFGDPAAVVRLKYSKTHITEKPNMMMLTAPLEGVRFVLLHFNDAGGCSFIQVVPDTTDQDAVVKRLEGEYGKATRLGTASGMQFCWGVPEARCIMAWKLTDAALQKLGTPDEPWRSAKGLMMVNYMDDSKERNR